MAAMSRRRPTVLLALAPLCMALACGAARSAAPPPPVESVPWELRAGGWRADPAWYDGRAEKCTYDSTRTIYGEERRYVATAYTNKQRMDPETTTKSADDAAGAGVEVFKHHWSERVPTESYDYDFSTATFTRTEDLAPFKLVAATQDDCGASFKQLWRDGERLRFFESVYFPGAGTREGALDAAGAQVFDALPLVLRDFPFDSDETFTLRIVPSQKSTRSEPFEPRDLVVRRTGSGTHELASGEVIATHELELAERSGAVVARYAFAADGSAPLLHALVSYEGPNGESHRLRALERTAYWER